MNRQNRAIRAEKAGTYVIVKRELLRHLIHTAVGDKFGGNFSKAVRETNKRVQALNKSKRAAYRPLRRLSQPELWRLAAGKVGRIRESTLVWLAALLQKDAALDL